MKKLLVLFFCGIVLMVSGCGESTFKEQPEFKQMQTAINNQDYSKAEEYLKVAYDKQKLKGEISNSDKVESGVIFNYINALKCKKSGNLYSAYKPLSRMPSNYSGTYASEARSLLILAQEDYKKEE